MKIKRTKNKVPTKQGRHYAKNHKIVERRIDDTVFLVNPKTDTIFHLNQLGTAIWNICAEPVSRKEITQTVQQAFPDVPSKKIAQDVYELFKQLIRKDFVAPCD